MVAPGIARDADAHDELGALEPDDLALAGVGQGAHAGGHRVQHLIELERRAELEAGVDQLAQLVVALLERAEQARLAERSRQQLAHRLQKVDVGGEVARLVVVDVDQAVHDAVDHEWDRDAAAKTVLVKDAAILGVDQGIVGRSQNADLLRFDRGLDARVGIDAQRAADDCVVVA